MNAIRIAALMLALLVQAGCTLDLSQKPPTSEEAMGENACMIRCPTGTENAGMSGSVTCNYDSAPVCQCTDGSRPVAACEPIKQ